MDTVKTDLSFDIKKYSKLLFIFFSSIIIYILAVVFNNVFINIMPTTSYLAWHTMFEFASILVSFSIFAVTHFIYEENGNLSMLIFGCAFLSMSCLDMFHTLSYKGMADFFIVNDTANRATTLWIFSRLSGVIGIMSAIFISPKAVSKIKKEFFVIITILFSIGLFLIVTYYPNFFPTMFVEGQGLTKIKILIEYIIILILAINFISLTIEYTKTNSRRDYMFMMALVLLIFSEFAFTNYGSIYDAFNYVGHFFKVVAYIFLYRAVYVENLTAPYRELKKTKNELKVYSDNLDILVEKRTEELNELNEVLLTDIEYAKEVQSCLLPAEMPQNMLVTFNAEFFIAAHLSGDFYNVIKLDEDNIAVYIGDVSGHGVAAAMLTVFANQNVIQLKERKSESNKILKPGIILKTIYNSFNKTNINAEKYILMIYGIYNIKHKSFTYSSAGINVPPYIIKYSCEVIEMDVKGLPICKLGDLVDPFYENKTIQLESGDKILFYSDGLVEAKNELGEEYGHDKLKNLLRENHVLNSSELNATIKSDFFSYIGSATNLMDDTTLLIMEISS